MLTPEPTNNSAPAKEGSRNSPALWALLAALTLPHFGAQATEIQASAPSPTSPPGKILTVSPVATPPSTSIELPTAPSGFEAPARILSAGTASARPYYGYIPVPMLKATLDLAVVKSKDQHFLNVKLDFSDPTYNRNLLVPILFAPTATGHDLTFVSDKGPSLTIHLGQAPKITLSLHKTSSANEIKIEFEQGEQKTSIKAVTQGKPSEFKFATLEWSTKEGRSKTSGSLQTPLLDYAICQSNNRDLASVEAAARRSQKGEPMLAERLMK